jgi:hypothetical protein
MCELYEPWIQWLFVVGVALTGSHYRMDIISGIGHPRSDSMFFLYDDDVIIFSLVHVL